MSTATWSDLVATALLGTDRRPIPSDLTAAWAVRDNDDEDAATQILELAALHRSWVRAGSRLHQVDPPLAAPTSEGSLAGYAAQELLGRLLERPEPDVINSWLSVCADRGLGVWADHWQPLAVLAAKTVAYDRRLLGRVFGARGIWFLEQNPAWSRLAAQVRAALAHAEGASGDDVDAPEVQPSEAVQAEIDAVFEGEGPRDS